MLAILKQCSDELDEWPEDAKGELADAVARLERGHKLSLPLSRLMPNIGRGEFMSFVFEIALEFIG